jgi:xanthine dehydrogenase accessory factor
VIDAAVLQRLVAERAPAAVCTVVDTSGSTPRKAGATMVVVNDGSDAGRIEGTIGGGAVEHRVRARALQVIASGRAELVEVNLTKELGMCCGGTMRVFIESIRTRPRCVLFGAGHVSLALCRAAGFSGFDVTVVDARPELLTSERFPDAVTLIDDDVPSAADAAALIDVATFVVIATHDHALDQQIVERILPLPSAYVALVGSARKAKMTRDRCAQKGIAVGDITRLACPAGLNIRAETPEEIALSIAAQMVSVLRDAVARRDDEAVAQAS